MILTKEQIDLMSETECSRALKQMERDHRLDTPYSQLTKEERDQCDDIGNTLLWLEDRLKEFRTTEIAQQANAIRWANHKPQPKIERTGPKRKQFRIGETIYTDVQTAALKTGVKVATLRQYVGRNPEMYAYVD